MKINKEILSNTSTHIFYGVKVKIYPSTQNGNTVSAEIQEGTHKGKLTTVYLNEAIKLESN